MQIREAVRVWSVVWGVCVCVMCTTRTTRSATFCRSVESVGLYENGIASSSGCLYGSKHDTHNHIQTHTHTQLIGCVCMCVRCKEEYESECAMQMVLRCCVCSCVKWTRRGATVWVDERVVRCVLELNQDQKNTKATRAAGVSICG